MRPESLRLAPYRPELAARWNAFVATSKNGALLFDRGFMDYHADRFEDASLIAFEGDGEATIAALLPLSRVADRWISHGGLTFGGWITDGRMTAAAMLALFDRLRETAAASGIRRLLYKAAPRCYHRLPADEDLYALFVNGARQVRQDVSSVIELSGAPAWAKGRKHALAKARRHQVVTDLSDDFDDFHDCLSDVLAPHGAAPVHTVAELRLLASRFPEAVRLYVAKAGGRAIAYALVLVSAQVVHTQYLATRAEGRQNGGLEAIVHRLQFDDFASKRYLSFGISTEQDGRVLNAGLVAQKEMFGARAMACAFYDLHVAAA